MDVDVRMYGVDLDGVIYVLAVVLSALYIVNKSKPLREVSVISERKKEGSVCRGQREVHEHRRLPSNADAHRLHDGGLTSDAMPDPSRDRRAVRGACAVTDGT